jgi:tetratricopeptide (TPR) repeat protein
VNLHTLEESSYWDSVAWSPDGTRLALGSSAGTLRIWNAATGEMLHTLEGHTFAVNDVAWNPSGTRLVSASNDNTLRIWDAATGENRHILEGHTGGVNAIAWHPSGTRLASAASDDTLRIWDATLGEHLLTLKGHTSHVYDVAWNPSGTRLTSASHDDTLRIWESRFDEALPMWQAAPRRRIQQQKATEHYRLKETIDKLFTEHVFVESVLEALRTDPDLSDADREEALRLATTREIFLDADDLNNEAWDLVDPDRENKDTDVVLALRLTRQAIEVAPEDYMLRDTHAWALFANGLHDEALVESARALELAPEDEKDDYQGYLDRMRAMIEEAQASAPEDN